MPPPPPCRWGQSWPGEQWTPPTAAASWTEFGSSSPLEPGWWRSACGQACNHPWLWTENSRPVCWWLLHCSSEPTSSITLQTFFFLMFYDPEFGSKYWLFIQHWIMHVSAVYKEKVYVLGTKHTCIHLIDTILQG